MRRFILALAAASAAASASAETWRTIERVAAGGYAMRIEEDRPGRGEQGSEEPPRLVITAPGKPPLTISVEGGLLPIRDGLGAAPRLAAGNTLRSRYVLGVPRLKDRAGRPLLLVFGQSFASDPGSFRVVSLAGPTPLVVYSDDTFELDAIADLDHDGVQELIGHRSLSQSWDECRYTYDPFSVMNLSAAGRYEYAEPLSRAYNEAHYVWAGPQASEAVAVDKCHGGLKIVPAPKPE